MPDKPKRKKPARKKPTRENDPVGADGTRAVDEFLAKVDHPQKATLQAVRKIVREVHPDIREGIKWNAASFHYKEWFATTGLRSKEFVLLVFHKGAKARPAAEDKMQIDDPSGLLEWLAKDRCVARFQSVKSIKQQSDALRAIVEQWIAQM